LGEILHPGEYSDKYPNAARAFYNLRNNKVRSWYGKVDEAFRTGFTNGLIKLQERPGEFARRLDALIRSCSDSPTTVKKVLNAFSEVAGKVSNKVLLELLDHFNNRRLDQTHRRVAIPGARTPQNLPLLKKLSSEIVDSIEDSVWLSMKAKFALLNPLGKVWIDPDLKKIPIPSGMKTLNESLKPVIRGMRVPLQLDKDTLRVGVFYHNARTNQCIDLSAMLVGRGSKGQLNWTTKKIGDWALHSGDSYGRTGDVSEFMDFNLPKVLENGYKYIAIFMHNYSRTKSLEDGAIVGFQGRQRPDANRDWKQDSVEHTTKIQNLKHKCVYCVIDASTREYIIVDEDSDAGGITIDDKFLTSITEEPKVSVYDLLEMHADSRGEIVDDVEEANLLFTFDEFSQSYKQILEYML
jgi:hypothetical protein